MHRISLLRVIDSENLLDTLTEEEKKKILGMNFTEETIKVVYENNSYHIIGNVEYYYYAIQMKSDEINIMFLDESPEYLNQVVEDLIYRLTKEILNPMETAFIYQEIFELSEYRQKTLARRVDRTQGAISNKLRLLKLPAYIQVEIFKGTITERHGRALLQMRKNPFFEKISKVLLSKTLKFDWNVARLEKEIDIYLNKPKNEEVRFNIKELKSKRLIDNTRNILAINEIEDGIRKSIEKINQFHDKLKIEEVSGLTEDDYVFLIRLKDIND